MSARRKGRILAFQALYSWDALGSGGGSPLPPEHREAPKPLEDLQGLLEFSWLDKAPEPELSDFSRLLILGTIENISPVDAMIRSHLKNWDLSRLNRVDLAVLRISTYTLMYQGDVPPAIIIDEAIGICKEYSADESFRFINGVLDGIRRTIQAGTPSAAPRAAGPGQE